ncbi:MAG: dUTPase [Erysipelothrix sp.]|nr:dUTPase [Erysipelothrix sp.]
MINELYAIQKDLDDRILKEHNLDADAVLSDRYLAFLVELGELANETRCFKFWSLKGPSEKSVILEEFSDVLHFLLSLGLALDSPHLEFYMEETDRSLTELFNSVYNDANIVFNLKSKFVYVRMFNSLMQIASKLGFSQEDVYASYTNKNAINHQRQDDGY